jgi:molecular chaperone DnaK (HSP70)
LPSWVLAVDYGTTYTTAAIREGNRVDLVQVADSPWIPSTVLLDTEGQLLAGHSAEAQATIYPTYTDKSISLRGEAESGTLPGLVRWWTTN